MNGDIKDALLNEPVAEELKNRNFLLDFARNGDLVFSPHLVRTASALILGSQGLFVKQDIPKKRRHGFRDVANRKRSRATASAERFEAVLGHGWGLPDRWEASVITSSDSGHGSGSGSKLGGFLEGVGRAGAKCASL